MGIVPTSGIVSLAHGAGLAPRDAVTATAIALAESGGEARAHNTTPPDNSYGLWQINMLGAMGPQRRKQLGLGSNDELFDPAVNARAMAHISSGGKNFTPWTTYTSGIYLRHMQEANSASSGIGANPSEVSNPLKGFGNLIKAFRTITDRSTWIRVGLFLSGFVLMLIALARLSGNDFVPLAKKAIGLVVTKKVV